MSDYTPLPGNGGGGGPAYDDTEIKGRVEDLEATVVGTPEIVAVPAILTGTVTLSGGDEASTIAPPRGTLTITVGGSQFDLEFYDNSVGSYQGTAYGIDVAEGTSIYQLMVDIKTTVRMNAVSFATATIDVNVTGGYATVTSSDDVSVSGTAAAAIFGSTVVGETVVAIPGSPATGLVNDVAALAETFNGTPEVPEVLPIPSIAVGTSVFVSPTEDVVFGINGMTGHLPAGIDIEDAVTSLNADFFHSVKFTHEAGVISIQIPSGYSITVQYGGEAIGIPDGEYDNGTKHELLIRSDGLARRVDYLVEDLTFKSSEVRMLGYPEFPLEPGTIYLDGNPIEFTGTENIEEIVAAFNLVFDAMPWINGSSQVREDPYDPLLPVYELAANLPQSSYGIEGPADVMAKLGFYTDRIQISSIEGFPLEEIPQKIHDLRQGHAQVYSRVEVLELQITSLESRISALEAAAAP